jgi:hypothetical protein
VRPEVVGLMRRDAAEEEEVLGVCFVPVESGCLGGVGWTGYCGGVGGGEVVEHRGGRGRVMRGLRGGEYGMVS